MCPAHSELGGFTSIIPRWAQPQKGKRQLVRSEEGSPGVREGNRVMVWECARALEELRLTDHRAPCRTAVSGDLEKDSGGGS